MLSFFVKKLIEYYWNNVPEDKRRVCIYKVSCSRFVYNEIDNYGFFRGLNSYILRRKNCNSNYSISIVNEFYK